jgi:hypothetical protein
VDGIESYYFVLVYSPPLTLAVMWLHFWVVAVDNNVVGGVIKVKWVILYETAKPNANESGFVSREALSGNRART